MGKHDGESVEANAEAKLTKEGAHDTVGVVVDTTVAEHETLKYHLLGPSLTKAGQGGVDQTKVRNHSPHVGRRDYVLKQVLGL